MKATMPVLLCAPLLATGLAAQQQLQNPNQPKVSSRRPVDVSVEGLGEAARRAPGDSTRASSMGLSARRTTESLTPFDCIQGIADQADPSGCLMASSSPTLGMLYPYPGLNNVFVPSAFVGGGEDNEASGPGATVGGGKGNTASGSFFRGYATVAGGQNNQATGPWSTVGGGRSNTVSGVGGDATVGGGAYNDASGSGATIGGGSYNVASGSFATVGGGGGCYAGVCYGNTASGLRSTVGGGALNQALGLLATVGGGVDNTAGSVSTVGGGDRNTASGGWATVSGGLSNTASGTATVGGGRGNTASGGSTIAGGGSNTASGRFATVPGGYGNTALGDYSFAAGRHAKANHDGAFVWGDSQSTGFFTSKPSSAPDEFNIYASGGVRMFTNSAATTGVLLAAGGSTWTMVSDRDAKENVEPVDARVVLDKVAELPLATWNYKDQDDSIRHMGPMAQDFYAAFGLGLGDKTIDTIDPNGVALAAIQGLNAELEERLAEKDEEIEELREQVAALARQVNNLASSR